MAHVFISYSHKDKAYAHKLANELKRWEIDAWIDDRIDYGSQWPRVIQESLDACPTFIVIMSSNAYHSEWVQNEVSYAQGKRKAIFPILLEGDVWVSFAAKQYADARNGELPPNTYFETIKRKLGVRKVRTETEQVVQKTRRPLIDQQLINRIVDHIYTAIINSPDTEWEIGLFKISYQNPKKRPAWLNSTSNYVPTFGLFSELMNLDLLSRYDSTIYSDYKINYERIMQKRNLAIKTSRVYLDHIIEISSLRKRLNLDLSLSSVQEFTEQLIDLHKAHKIPVDEIKIKLLK
jgi:hypothetical protein